MFFLCGYDFCSDGNALNVAPATVSTVTSVEIENGIFDHMNITKDITSTYSPTIPTSWDDNTIMDCNFENNVNAGNINFVISNLDGFYIKRRKVDEYNWVTLKYIDVSEIVDFRFAVNDNLAASLETYQYAIVPVLNGVEGDYLAKEITTQFQGVYICDENTIKEFRAGVQYGGSTQNQKVATFEPLGRKYPIVIYNANTSYISGSVQGTILNDNFYKSNEIDRKEIVAQQKSLLDFLTDKSPKMLKDWNSNIWLISISGSPTISYYNDIGMGIADVAFSYVEIGDANNQDDLINSGILSGV